MADKLNVLIPVDFSETSRRALAWAFDYAMRAPCELHVLHVVESHFDDILRQDLTPIDTELRQAVTQTQAELHRMLPDEADRRQVTPIHHHSSTGKPSAEILLIAEKIGADMIVMGTHGRSGVAGLLIGSVAEKIVKHADCPVVCVKPGRREKVT